MNITSNPSKRGDVAAAISELSAQYGAILSTKATELEHHSKGESYHSGGVPDALVRPVDVAQISGVVAICQRHGVPLIAFGTGTSLEGGVIPLFGGITLDLQAMNNIIAIHPEDMDVVVQPGVTRKQLNHVLREHGLFFPVDPGADASLGGMTATRASGTNAVRYGTMRENVMSLQAVLADGRIIQTGKRARKSAAGYDLTRLLVGSEGTLAIISEIVLKVHPIPEAISAATCGFASLQDAVNAVINIIQYGIPIARIELIDAMAMEAINQYSNTDYALCTTLFLEFHGSNNGVQEQAELCESISKEYGGSDYQWTSNQQQRDQMWQARHDAAWAIKRLRPDGEIWSTDVCVPISKLAQCMLETQQDIAEAEVIAPIVGHVGDGNFHLAFLVDHDDPAEVAKANTVHDNMVRRALAMGGTCTGEHGIGYGKLDYLAQEHGEAVTVMTAIKQALDPANILNPGKVVRAWD